MNPPSPGLKVRKINLYLSDYERQRSQYLTVGRKLDMPVAGFRGWQGFNSVTRGLLPMNLNYAKGFEWKLGQVNYGRCRMDQQLCADCSHYKAGTCECGLYCFHKDLPEQSWAGIVLGWGTVIQHQWQGFRASQAQIVAMIYRNKQELVALKEHMPEMMHVEEKHKMEFARQFGIILTDSEFKGGRIE
jgi:hypothetical protein